MLYCLQLGYRVQVFLRRLHCVKREYNEGNRNALSRETTAFRIAGFCINVVVEDVYDLYSVYAKKSVTIVCRTEQQLKRAQN
jgi:hypothetical protein